MSSTIPVSASASGEMFLDLVRAGHGQVSAALQVGWSLRQLKQYLAAEDFAELVLVAETQVNEDVESVLLDSAKRGNLQAIKMWLYNRADGRWADRREVKVEGNRSIEVSVVHSTKEALKQLIAEQGVDGFQPGGVLDDPDIIDAELVDE